MQTKITTFQKGNQTVELHAQLHFGDEQYYEYWNNPAFNDRLDNILFELLIDENLLEMKLSNPNQRTVKAPIMASPNDQALAQQYGWKCQASSLDYMHPKWIHADLSRQEFLQFAHENNTSNNRLYRNSNLPLWKLALTLESSVNAAEAVVALMVGPPTLLPYYSNTPQSLKRRLFTNLFLPGSTLAFVLRAVLWWTVPAPELSILLLDWSSLLTQDDNEQYGTTSKSNKTPSALFSQMTIPILTSLVSLQISHFRRYLFGQVLLSSSTSQPPPSTSHSSKDSNSPSSTTPKSWSFLITKRNDHALQVLQSILFNQPQHVRSVAILYGSSHCPDLHQKLIADYGFQPIQSTWRTAWSVPEGDKHNDDRRNVSSTTQQKLTITTILPITLTVFLSLYYLAVGALDWVGMLGNVSESIVVHGNYVDAMGISILYLLRHVLLYLTMSKFLIDWTS